MEFTYEANLPLLRRLAILLMAFSDSDDSDLEEQFEIINASEEDLYDKEASENDRKSDEEIEKEAEEILSTIGNLHSLTFTTLRTRRISYRRR